MRQPGPQGVEWTPWELSVLEYAHHFGPVSSGSVARNFSATPHASAEALRKLFEADLLWRSGPLNRPLYALKEAGRDVVKQAKAARDARSNKDTAVRAKNKAR